MNVKFTSVNVTYFLGDIVWVSFGQIQNSLDGEIDHEIKGRHLAVFLWSEGALVTVVPITSFLDKEGLPKQLLGGDFSVPAGIGGLYKDSIIRIHQPHSVDRKKIIKRSDRFNPAMIDRLLGAIEHQIFYKLDRA